MKNKVIKIIALILITLIVTIIISAITNKSQAVFDVTEDLDYWSPTTTNSTSDLDEKINIIVGIVRLVGILISVITLSVIGIKFMLGSTEEKAQYKQTLFPWLIGAVLVFAITFIPTLIYDMVSGANGVEQVQVSIDKSSVTLKIGENEETTLSATVTSEANRTVKWFSTNSKVATVDSNGKVTAKSEGVATIKAVSGTGEASCEVIVEAAKTTNITISKTSITLNAPITNTYQLSATVTPANSQEPITWNSSNNNVATVQNGKVRAVGAGTAVITAKTGTKSATCTVQVNSSRVYSTMYYNQDTKTVSSTRSSNNDLGFWIYIPESSKVADLDKIPLIVFLHGSDEKRK